MLKIILSFFVFLFFQTTNAEAACGATTRTWDGSFSILWSANQNWSGNSAPVAGDNAIIVSSGSTPTPANGSTVNIACLDIQSGTVSDAANQIFFNITGDYFQAPNSGSLTLTKNTTTITMAGTAAQTFEAVDNIQVLTITNTVSVQLKNTFTIKGALTLPSSGTTYINGNVTLTSALTVPAGHTLQIENGGTLNVPAGLTVAGTVQVDGGGRLRMASGTTLSVSSGGILKGLGSSGNPATIISYDTSSSFSLNVVGTLSANYLLVSGVNNGSKGIYITGTVLQFNNTNIKGVTVYGITLGASASLPATWTTVGFFDDRQVGGTKNINATAYTGSAFTVTDYSGDLGGVTYETDPSNKVTWGTQAATVLEVTNQSTSGIPTSTMNASATQVFANFSFTLNNTDTATNVTEVIFTMNGSASMSDIASVKAYRDNNQNCVYDAGSDSQVGSNLTFSGSPPKATLTIPIGNVQTGSINTDLACLHIVATTVAAPSNAKTISFEITSTTDITNSAGYSLSSTSGTPLSSGATTISSTADISWLGGSGANGQKWSGTANWTTSTVPTTAVNCTVGVGANTTKIDTTPQGCHNVNLGAGGTLDFNTTSVLEVTGGLTVSSSYTFSSATTGTITMKGTTNQTMSVATAFPGNFIINNTGGAGSNQINVEANSTINGTLTCTAGVLNIPSGISLTVLGNITIQTGCTIAVNAGGTLKIGNGSTLTVNTGGIFQVVGSAASKAIVTSDLATSAYNVIVNGTIKARYYTFSYLNTTGVSIEAGATIDSTYHLQDGTFTYPVNNNTTMLFLKQQVPGNAMTDMVFSLGGSAATGTKNVNTTGAGAGTLTITTYSGNLSGTTYHVQPTYLIAWVGQINTISITNAVSSPASVIAGITYNMGSFGFQQDEAGASFVDTNVTSLKLQLIGTGSSTDISSVRLYRDIGCVGSGGTLIGTGTYAGNPATVTFSISSGDLVVKQDNVTTVKVCAYVEYVMSETATNGNTVGLELLNSASFVNSASYTVSTGFPLTLGTASTIIIPTSTTWTGATSTAWATASNWDNGTPALSVNCTIPVVGTNYPVISTVGPACKSLTISGGNLTINASKTLDVYNNYTHSAGTLTNNGIITIQDSAGNNHNIDSTPTIAGVMNFAANGSVYINNSSTTITNLGSLSSTTTLTIASGKKLILSNNYSLTSGKILIEANGTLEIANTKTLTVAGGTFQILGTDQAFPQTLATKGVIKASGGGTNSFGFTATSGTVDLVGFQFDRLNTSGLNIGGTTILSNLKGGQLTRLPTSYSSVKAIQINTTGTIPASATNIAWNWGDFNDFTGVNPDNTQNYILVSSTGCGNQTIAFSGWSGDWYETQTQPYVVTSKVSATSCTVTMGNASSAVSLLSFTAVPYNAAVDIRWETNVERDHLGFNVYRTSDGATRFVQVNKELIRNLKNSASNRGKYRFIDLDVANNENYYYYLEDVDIHGRTTMHGPVFAAPFSFLGSPPADGISENSATNTVTTPTSGTPATIPNPSYQDLGNGIVIISQTSHSLRIEITPPTPTFTASSWNGSYQNVAMAGYSKMTSVGNPELPEKDLLIEVHRFATTAAVNQTTIATNVLSSHLINPAPSYVLSGGLLVPSYAIESTTYASNSYYPNQTYPLEFYGIETNLVNVNDKKFLKLKINPLRINPVTQAIKMATKITLDIGLDGDDWDVTTPSSSSNIGPYAVENTLRIDYNNSGMYQIAYSDFINSQVEGPFRNTDTSLWRLYYKETEIPLEIYSLTGNFATGNYIRFYAPFVSSTESLKNQLILSPVNLTTATTAPKRMAILDSNPNGELESTNILTTFAKTIEQNSVFVDAFTLEDNRDHYFYYNMYSAAGGDTFSVTTTLPELDTSNSDNVIVKYYVRGELGTFGLPVKHHVIFSLGAYVAPTGSGDTYVAGNEEGVAIFEENERTILSFYVPANRLSTGNNTLNLKLPGTFATVGDYDRLLIDKIEITYKGRNVGSSQIATFSIHDRLRVHQIDRFTTNQIIGYDLTSPLAPKKLSNLGIGLDSTNVTYAAKFYVDGNSDSDNLKKFSFVTTSSFYQPTGLSLNPGVVTSLKDYSNSADLIVYGDENLLVAATDLINMRKAQGLEVVTITPAEVYSEFSYGVPSSNALRDFVTAALTRWRKAPRYLLIIGDGTNDPKDHNVWGYNLDERSAPELGTLPMPIIPGQFMDYSGDNYFVASNTSHLPRMAVGRIPTNDHNKIKLYIEKVRKYEEGTAAPVATLKNITFFADKDTTGNFEHFNQMSQDIMSVANGFTTNLFDRSILGTAALTRAKINDEFNNGSLMISFVGHGASDRFGSDIFTTTHADSLTNTIYPMVVSWNCETAYFYDTEKALQTLAEQLIFNPSGGAIVFMGSTTQTTPPAQTKLAQNFFNRFSTAIQKPYDGTRLGDLFYQAKVGVGSGSYEKDILNSFSIIGDPTLTLPPALFPASSYVATAPAAKKGGVFGCSANAGEGGEHSPWYFGFCEWLLYMFLMIFGVKKAFKRSSI